MPSREKLTCRKQLPTRRWTQSSSSITDALRTGGEVRLVGFGTFTVAERAASEGRNPRTGEKIQIAASKQAKFKPGKRLRDELNV